MWHLYLDESGDLGFNFRDKHPSSFLTIAVLATSHRETVDRIRVAVKRTLKNKINRKRKNEQELKGSSTTIEVKRYFYRIIKDCTFAVYAVTLNKIRVYDELRKGAQGKNRLYNYIARLVLEKIPFESAKEPIELIVDKSKGRQAMEDFNSYLQTQLASRVHPSIPINIHHRDSRAEYGLSAADLFCWGIFRKHERGDEEWFREFADKVFLDERYL